MESIEEIKLKDKFTHIIGKRLSSKSKRLDANIIILILYTFLSIILTYPVAFSQNKVAGYGDAFWYLWDFWWFKEAASSCSNPYYTTYLYYPNEASLAFSAVSSLNAIVSIPLQMSFGLVNAYNIIWMSTFILSGFATFLLVRYLTGDPRAAFIAGLIFMFCPYRFAHALGHMNLISTQWIPLYVLFLLKTSDENKITHALLAALFLTLTGISSYYYLIYLAVFTVFYLIYIHSSETVFSEIIILKRISTIVMVSILLLTPFLYPLIKELLISKSNYMYAGGFTEFSADLMAFFIPSIFHPLFGDFVSPFYQNLSGNWGEYVVFAGYTVLFLAAITIIKVKSNLINFFALSSVAFFILCLGPVLHINGNYNFSFSAYIFQIPLPYEILRHIPVFSLARVPSRWDVMLMLCLAVLAGYGASHIFKKYQNQALGKFNKSNVLSVILSVLILFEFLNVPFIMWDAEVPSFYHELAEDGRDYAIIEVPNFISNKSSLEYIYYQEYNPEYMYYQTVHRKRLVNGYLSRQPDLLAEFIDQTPVISHLMKEYPKIEGDIFEQDIFESASSILNYYNIKYIILHERLMTSEQIEFYNSFLNRSVLDDPWIYEKDSMKVYKIEDKPIKSFAILKGGWHAIENWNRTQVRWMGSQADIIIFSDEERSTNISFNILNFHRPRTLEIYSSNGARIWEGRIEGYDEVIDLPINLKEGENLIRFYVPEGCDRPSEVAELNSEDPRCLSFAIMNLKI